MKQSHKSQSLRLSVVKEGTGIKPHSAAAGGGVGEVKICLIKCSESWTPYGRLWVVRRSWAFKNLAVLMCVLLRAVPMLSILWEGNPCWHWTPSWIAHGTISISWWSPVKEHVYVDLNQHWRGCVKSCVIRSQPECTTLTMHAHWLWALRLRMGDCPYCPQSHKPVTVGRHKHTTYHMPYTHHIPHMHP